jgi:hypothetical protein
MRYALTQLDGQGTPFWVFLVQAFCVIIVAGVAITIVICLLRLATREKP